MAAIASRLSFMCSRMDSIIESCNLIDDYSLTLMFRGDKPIETPLKDDDMPTVERYNCHSKNLNHCFDEIVKNGYGTIGKGNSNIYTMYEYWTYGFEIRFGFNLDFTKSTFVKMLKCCASMLFVSSRIINEATHKKCVSGIYLRELNTFINANTQTGKLINNHIRKAYEKANKEYGFDLDFNKNSSAVIPDGFFDGISDKMLPRYETAVKSTGVKISENGNGLEITFDKDVVLYKVVLIIELAQNYLGSDSPEDIRVNINKTLFINEDVLEDRDWVKYMEYIHKVVATDVILERGFNELKLPENVFIDELEINNPYAPKRRYYSPKLFIDKNSLKNKEMKISSSTNEINNSSINNKERICVEFN